MNELSKRDLIFGLVVSVLLPIIMIICFNIGQATQAKDQATVQR